MDVGPAPLLFAGGFASIEAFLAWTESASDAQLQAMATLITEIADAAAQQGGDQ